jgi:superfamily II DNA or RNA helicase/diadenosine tetraphosphate (Ap4A) HIT family hydrolase
MSVFTARPVTAHVASNALAFAIRDGFPVSPGHTLVIPKREIPSWFDATAEERTAIFELVDQVKAALDAELHPDGYNIGINCGEAAGQSVMHLHVHVIPRYVGDVPKPRGGVRHVIPGKGDYPSSGPQLAPPTLLTTNEQSSLLAHLEIDLARASTAELAVAFVQRSGIERLRSGLEALLQRGGHLRLVTGDYLDVTDPDALQRLHDLSTAHPQQVELRVFESAGRSFHPKSYLFLRGESDGVAYVGSSNLSRSALEEGVEWNYRIVTTRDREGFAEVRRAFEELLKHPSTRALDEKWIEDYRKRRAQLPARALPVSPSSQPPVVPGQPAIAADQTLVAADQTPVAAGQTPVIPSVRATEGRPGVEGLPDQATNTNEASPAYLQLVKLREAPDPRPEPNEIQQEALAALKQTRAAGHRAGLVVMATGLGKTFLAAFDSEPSKRVLFIAHREEILVQAMRTFRRLRPQARFGLYDGEQKEAEADVVFGSIQTLGRQAHLDRFDPKAFDYLVIDEFHHASAATYRRLIEHFEPGFLLGLTATPERTDGGDLLQLCGENLVYRCDLVKGIERGRLSPFHYFGVPDEVDYRNIPWRSSHFDEEALTNAVATKARAQNALEQWKKLGGKRTLAFCVSQRHADFMRGFFLDQGVKAAAVHAGESSDPRATSLEKLGRGELEVLFAVDMFNEGVDLPAIDTVMMLRPTESRILWLQQLGRGLRLQEGKQLKVIDYIGNHRTFLLKARALLDLKSGDDRALSLALKKVVDNDWPLPKGCEITYELKALEIMKALLRLPKKDEALQSYYEDFRERTGQRPTAAETHHDGYAPRSTRKVYGSWLGFVEEMGDLSDVERAAFAAQKELLSELDSTQMTRSYKMLVLLAMLNADTLPGPGIRIERPAT